MMNRPTLPFYLGTCLLACLAGCDSPASSVSDAQVESLPTPAMGHEGPTAVEVESTSEDSNVVEIELEEPLSYKPFVARAVLVPVNLETPVTLTFIIRAKTAPGWHIYAEGGPAGISQPTRLNLQLPDGIEADGDWTYPEPTQGPDGSDAQLIYEGEVFFRRRLKVTDAALSGRLSVGCEITYQACDAFSCRPPETLKLEAVAEVVHIP